MTEEELAKWFRENGGKSEDLDELVHEMYSYRASTTNNQGVEYQIKELVGFYDSVEDLQRRLEGVLAWAGAVVVGKRKHDEHRG